MKNILSTLTAVIFSATLVYAQSEAAPVKSKEEIREHIREEIRERVEKTKAACAADMATMGCAAEEGRVLAKCVREYRKAHKDFKYSEECQAARKQGHELRAEKKRKRKANKAAASETK